MDWSLLVRPACGHGSLPGIVRRCPDFFVGVLYGLDINVVNLTGFSILFHRFSVSRDWVTGFLL